MSVPRTSEKSIFLEIIEISAGSERQAHLDRVCKDDSRLRSKVEALLRASAEPQRLLDAPEAVLSIIGESTDPERPGAVIGSYKLLEQIGEGGMGLVFVAEQMQPVSRRVAIKVIKPGMESRQVIARFEAERQALALMDHPHIAHIFDGGTTPSGRLYFVMELVRGLPITQFCDDNRLTLQERLELFVSVCQAVQHAHQKGIIHRDIKPSNVLVTSHDGTPVVKVIDFGIAKVVGQKLTGETLYTQFMQFVGTPVYLSPEQAGLSGIDVDTRTDIYSLGVLLYELLTGSTPFDRVRLQTVAYDEMRRILREEEPPRPSTRLSTGGEAASIVSANRQSDPKHLRELYRGELDWIVMKALEKDRTRRYETSSAFTADVQRYLRHEPVQACPPSVGYRLRKFARRHRAGVLAACLVGLALVVGIAAMTWGLIRATDAEADALRSAKQKEAALTTAQQSAREATDKLWLSLYERARAGRFSRQIGQRLESLAALHEAARIRPDERLRDEAIAAMALPDVRRVPGWPTSPPDTIALAVGGRCRLYARADSQGMISIRGIAEDKELRHIASGPITRRYLHFSPDERFLLGLGEADALRVWRVADGQPVLRDKLLGCRTHAFSLDGSKLAVGQQDWVVCLDLATGQETRRWRLPAQAHSLAFPPDASKLAVGYMKSTVVSVYDAASGGLLTNLPVGGMNVNLRALTGAWLTAKLLTDLPGGVINIQVVAWHPDGEHLAVAGSEPGIQLWHVATKRKVAVLAGHSQQVTELSFHPEADLLASQGWDGRLLLWHPLSGRQLIRLTSVANSHFSADGRWLRLTWDGNMAGLLEVTASREYRTLVSSAGAGKGGYGFGDISSDARLLAVGMDDGARLWDLGSGWELLRLPAGTPYVFFESRQAGKGPGPAPPDSPTWTLLASGPDGLRRWPIWTPDALGKRLRLGSPEQLSRVSTARFARSPDGRALVALTEVGGANQILDLATGTVRRDLGVIPEGEVYALSGDGKWAASCGWHSDRVGLWNIATGKLVHEWALGKRTSVFFTPDSRALIIGRGDEFSFWDVETFQRIRRLPRGPSMLPGWVAFSPDGRLMALEMAPGVINLMELTSGRTVAKLADPHGDRATWQGFTPDGTRLVVVASSDSVVHVWDLRAIRARLKEMNLDWDWPEFAQPVSR